ncbi:MAG: hypothetical protein RLZZ127_1771 [Planctomycetota bacterium]|jgi:alpha-N-arabinofuranosidase
MSDALPFPARLVLDGDFITGPVDPRLFGSFVEHLGRAVYGGLYEPGHPTADADGFRTDVLALVRELGVTIVRYPGGNFVSNYAWEDGVGPRERRPRRRDLAWMSTDSNAFGTDEFAAWCRAAGVAPMLAVNLGTRGPREAGELLEYCNHPGGTALSDRRRAHGAEQPHRIGVWCLGNEMDGRWQMGATTAVEYGRRAREAAKLMRFPDANQAREDRLSTPIELVACGSSSPGMGTFITWEREVLEQCYDQVDHISLHRYADCRNGDIAGLLAAGHGMRAQIRAVAAVCDAVQAATRSRKRMGLCFDEWNVWYHSTLRDRQEPAWAEAPSLLEDVYTLADALAVGGMLIALLAHADRVRIACLAQLVNAIGPIMTRTGGPAWRQTIFHPFAWAARHGHGTVLDGRLDAPPDGAGGAPLLDGVAVRTTEGGVNLMLLNRSLDTAAALRVDCRGLPGLEVAGWEILHGDDLHAVNEETAPDRVRLRPATGAVVDGTTLRVTLPPASWSGLRLVPRG